MINIKKNSFKGNGLTSSSDNSEVIENVLILQGGGSLGAFGCGVFKALSQNEVKIEIVAGTFYWWCKCGYHSWQQRGERARTILGTILARVGR